MLSSVVPLLVFGSVEQGCRATPEPSLGVLAEQGRSRQPDHCPEAWTLALPREEIRYLPSPIRHETWASEIHAVLERVALPRYPVDVIRRELDAILLVGALEDRERIPGGMYVGRVIVLSTERSQRRVSRAGVVTTFHAEFSSILLASHPEAFDEEQWLAANPSNFVYDPSLARDILTARYEWDPFESEFWPAGFLNSYAMTSVENDFNQVAKSAWSGHPFLWQAAARHPALRRKLGLVIDFYEAVLPAEPGGLEERLRSGRPHSGEPVPVSTWWLKARDGGCQWVPATSLTEGGASARASSGG